MMCAGNTCRSPMAAAIARAMIKGNYEFDSVGFPTRPPTPSSPVEENAKNAIKALGFEDTTREKSRFAEPKDIEGADIIFCMDDMVLRFAKNMFPKYKDKFFLYTEEMVRVPDPLDLQHFETIEGYEKGSVKEKSPEAYSMVAQMMAEKFTPQLEKNLKSGKYFKPKEGVASAEVTKVDTASDEKVIN